MVASELGIDIEDIADFELNLYDVQPASLGGAYSEFVHSARLDNLASCYLALRGLVDHTASDDGLDLLADDEDISMIALFDHEEVGSSSLTGAGSPIMSEAVRRISSALGAGDAGGSDDLYASALARSFVLSVDQAHAIHPNYASKHEKNHAPRMNDGMVIKRNANQRYATNGITGFVVREIARRAGLSPVQEFVVRNDCGCGSTIGPIISAATGMRAIDLGCPQLSMHSIRETMGVCDCECLMFSWSGCAAVLESSAMGTTALSFMES
uniref:aspartyl aminopeptidase n=2 Tax=Odontella aurita TaxID=265563 RepID=A0A7S4IQR4_9STRA|mmetsp:Transcript_28855/g.85204  ORF Transcript_28855/g.85204 Transcript_28855/m.85204 type:complete len:269 (+) Transcript_28855:1258-2064(+)